MLMTACVGSLAADINPATGQWRITAEYLYLLPTVDDTFFVIDSPVTTDFPNGSRKNNDFNFKSGWRLGGGYTFCENSELQVMYTNLNASQSKTVTGDFLWGTAGNATLVSNFENYAGSASSSLSNKYQRLDVLYAQELFSCGGLDFAVQFGLEAAELRLNEGYTYTALLAEAPALVGIADLHSKTKGIGPQIGFSIDYELYRGDDCCPGVLSLNVVTGGSLLAADTKNSVFSTVDDDIVLDVSDSKSWRVIPALHASIGLNYDMAFDCVDASFGIGYEFSSYLRGLSRVSFPDDVAEGLSYNNYYNFDLQGLYVSGSVKF